MFFPAIEGATPIDDASGLKLAITTLEELYSAEARNIAKVMLKYLAGKPSRRSAPFDLDWILKLHKEMYGDVWKWAGHIRNSKLNIGVAPHHIREELHKLLGDLRQWQPMDLLEQAVRLHHRAAWIHPFPNGNGRWARMLCNIWLKQHGSSPVLWPATMHRESTIRKEYISAIKEGDKNKLEPFLKLHRKYYKPDISTSTVSDRLS